MVLKNPSLLYYHSMATNTDSILFRKISELQTQYYSGTKKNRFFKTQQKNDCAASIAQQVRLPDLLKHTIYVIQGTNQVYFDYTVFKTYANPNLFEPIIDYFIQLVEYCIATYGCYEMHVNWLSYSISAHERFKGIYNIHQQKCIASPYSISDSISTLHVYNVPTVIDTLSSVIRPLIDPMIVSKVIMHKKGESDHLIQELLHIGDKTL